MPKRLQREFLQKRYKPPVSKKRRFFKRLLLILVILGTLALWVGLKIKGLEDLVEKKFNVAKRWNIPSRVYADTEYLYPGVDTARRGLLKKLERLSYRQVSQIKGPGDFATGEGRIDIYLHDFAYPQEKFSGFPVRLQLEGALLKKILDLESSEELPLARLEPEEIAALFDVKMEDRTLVTLKEIPQYLLEAIILIEDERFFKHKGIDPVAILRAAVANFMHLRIVQGGSTLTQQLVKNFFLTSKKSISRKINEALMALILESKHSKAEILEAYINEIYLGQRGPSSVTGVGEAAKHYFAKDIHQITLAEAALLAGIIRNPSEYSPFRSKPRAFARRNFILKKMRDAAVIDEKAYQEAIQEEIVTPKIQTRPAIAPYFVDFLKSQLADLYPEEVLETEGLRIFTTLDMELQTRAKEDLIQGLRDLENKFGSLLPKGYEGKLQGCLIVISPQNGYVRAMVGGRDYLESQFNRCTQGRRQPGSTFKPFVYLTALDPAKMEKPFTLASLIEDKSFTIDTPEGPWSPENYDKKEHGTVVLREALENSYNIATAKLGLEVGLEKIVQTAKDAGITSDLSPFPALSLGAFEVTPLEMAEAFSVFPNLGVKANPLSIINVMTPQGEVLEKKIVKIKRVFDEAPVSLVNSLMQGVIERGTAQSALPYGFGGKAAGKTGTTSNYKDAWFTGFTPELLTLVWVGYDDNTPIQMSGARAALPIWISFMKGILGSQTKEFTFPLNVVQVDIDPETGKLATHQCPKVTKEYFIKGTEPTEYCPHKGGKELPSEEEF